MFMVYLAIINVSLILFDLTYLWLRPQYFRLLPIVTDVYDPVKGIEPHPLTERYLVVADETDALLAAGVSPVELVPRLSELGELSAQIVTENPFERSGQTRSFIRLQVGVKDYLQREGTLASSARPSGEEVLELFWSLEPSPGLLPARSDFFQSDLRPLLAVNYHRAYDLDGELVDKFWMIDLPFLLIFAFEFGVRWYLSIRRSNLGNWFLFPILNWYDLLGIIPVKQMRLFRLFRIGSIYVRLKRSDHSTVGDDFVTRTVKYFTNIISEEISDMVALRILTETQKELREGTHRRIIRAVAEPHRDALAAELTQQIQEIFTDQEIRDQARQFLDANLEQAVESAAALRRIPLPDALLRALVTTIGQALFDSFADTLAATLSSSDGQETLERIVGKTIDGVVVGLTEGELEALVREISIDVIGHVKESVAVRKWALPDKPSRVLFTEDLGAD
jgi:energy-coupling factor transporter transmembrane protein EcfT